MSLQHKTDAEVIETAKKLAGYSEAGGVLKELVKRWQVNANYQNSSTSSHSRRPQNAILSGSMRGNSRMLFPK